jgi:hypothetical protein
MIESLTVNSKLPQQIRFGIRDVAISSLGRYIMTRSYQKPEDTG